jgi:hypothetical protein
MKLYEYRFVIPTNLEKYRIGFGYTIDQISHEPEGMFSTEGVELRASEPYQTETESGQYMHTVMHNKSRIPAFLRLVVPDKYLTMHSKRWDAYPHERMEMSNPGMGDDFLMVIETRNVQYHPGEPFPDNLHNLNPDQLAARKVLWLDIVDSKPQPDKAEDTLRGFVCPEGGIATPLTGSGKPADESKPPAWTTNYPGDMICSVRVVHFKFKWRGLQTMIEKNMIAMNRTMSLGMQRRVVRGAGHWFNMSLEDARAIEMRRVEEMTRQAPSRDAEAIDEI